ncbi:hypothetical protein L210DRAFT_3636287 [Boletus edulis BED1]|uniref:Uncharacterized protein n=1 Tax=Boletus edulis BED1 TaxID=1328754 RepID=A0AAD4G6B7_BOLED|nr:hypothetical protein L210DRAFT_3512790 [Boletus edulis BED1]KAF8417614.1 hypothetical protein L210DRAFT_3636287 [Boletus edulis BED1]
MNDGWGFELLEGVVQNVDPKSLLVLRENCVRHGIASAVGDDAEDLACTEVGFKTESPGALGDRALCAAVPSNVSWEMPKRLLMPHEVERLIRQHTAERDRLQCTIWMGQEGAVDGRERLCSVERLGVGELAKQPGKIRHGVMVDRQRQEEGNKFAVVFLRERGSLSERREQLRVV